MSERASNVALNNALIAKVKATPEMWSFTHPLYRNRAVHKNFWAEVSEELNVEENLARKRWKHLKDQYRKELKRSMEKGLPEEGIAWQYFDSLEFLREDVMRDSSGKSSTTHAESEAESEEEEVPAKVKVVETRTEDLQMHMIYKGMMETKAVVEERMKSLDDLIRHDPDYMCLMSLLPTLRQLTEIQKLQLKGKINEWFLEALTAQEYISCDTKYIVTGP